jgi:acyl carrier protein
MPEREVYRRLTTIFHDVFDDESLVLRPDTSAANVEGWDSLNHINLILAAESAFQVKFTSSDLESIQSVGDLVAAIQQKVLAHANAR